MDDTPEEAHVDATEEAQEEHEQAQDEVITAQTIEGIRAELAAVREMVDAINTQLSAVELKELLEAIHEEHEADIAPRSSSWLYRTIGRRED